MVNLNGEILSSTTSLSNNNRSFLYGDGVFETLKIVNNKVYYITPIIDEQIYKEENLDADLKVVRDKKIVNFVKIECDIFSKKFTKSDAFRYFFISEKELKKQITKPKKDTRLNFQFN